MNIIFLPLFASANIIIYEHLWFIYGHYSLKNKMSILFRLFKCVSTKTTNLAEVAEMVETL